MRWALLVLAACSGPAATSDAGTDAAAACTATFSGHFAEISTTAANCPTLGDDHKLQLAIASTTIADAFHITIDLGGPPTPGAYSSETLGSWSSLAIQSIGAGECLFVAGATESPAGSFTLALDGLAPPRGRLQLLANVLAVAGTNCGPGDIERLAVDF